jgi:capsular exopolysaccharide synthesis family protein
MQSANPPKPSMMDLVAKARVMAKRYVVTARKFWWIPALTMSLGLLVSTWKGVHLTPTYVSTSQMVLTGQFQIEGTARITEAGDFLGTQFALILGDQVAQRARDKVRAQHPDWIAVPVTLNIGQVPHTSFLSLTANGLEPIYTQAYLDAAMQEYMAFRKEMRVEKSDSMTSAIRNQLLLLEKQTKDDEQAIVTYQQDNKIGFIQSQNNYAAEYLSTQEQKLAELKTDLNLYATLSLDQNIDRSQQQLLQRQQQQASLQQSGTANRQSADDSMSSFDSAFINNGNVITEYQRAKQDLGLLKDQRNDLLKIMKPGPNNTRILDIEDKIAKTESLMLNYKSQCDDLIKMRKDALAYQIKSKESVIREWSAKAMDLSQKLAEYERLRLKLDYDRKQYDQLIATLQSVDIYKNVEQESLSILTNASPAVPSKESLIKTIFSGFATGLFAGLAIIFLIDKTDDKIGALIECQGNFKEYAILGQIPHESMEGDLSLLVPYDPRHALLEAFRALRSSILFAPVEGTRPKALMVSSAMEGEGKSTIASNLAATLAFSGAKTLLIDCNLNDGHLHELFGTTPDRGLMNVLQQQIPWNEAVVETNIDNLFLLPRGEALAYPAEHYFGAFLKDIYQEFDYIIFDTAPILDDVDALSFAPIVDGVLFIIRFGQTSSAKATRALDSLQARQVNILGLICNDV